ncbi:hypothetical protein F2Q68_00005802 [Brassica cretica]|uniref:Rotamase n=1 Tax=Brassica cretica TaxID=69181 RepID=A0A8S9JB92_BRACR|nr:hypothetical protein F2Q68_00005802 [Brassica cretica]
MENRKGGNFSVPSSEALTTTLRNAIQALGRGFDVTSDVRLLYCKGAPGSRLVHIEEGQNRDLELSDGFFLPNVPVDIECSPGEEGIQRIPVCTFHENWFTFEVLVNGKPDGKIAVSGRRVRVRYTGRLQKNGKIFDDKFSNATMCIRFNFSIHDMHVGENRKITVPLIYE